jgi:competence protein ComEC
MERSPVCRQPFVGLALAAVAGMLFAEFVPLPIGVCLGALGCASLGALVWRRSLGGYLIAAGAFCLLHSVQQVDAPGKRLAAELGERPRPVTVTGAVVTEPKNGTGDFMTFLLQLDEIEVGGVQERSAATVRIRWKGTPQLGDEIRLTGLAEPIPPARNPGVFDLQSYLARRDVYRSVFARYPEDGEILPNARGDLVLRLAAKSRAWMQSTLTRGLEDSPPVGALISGMALGLRHETRDDIEEPFQQTGTLHLFAVAGLHVGIIAQLLWILARLCRLPRVAAAATIIPFLFFYSAITGLHVSSVRAATMAAVLLGGIFFERRVFALNSLAAAAVLILAWDPNQLFNSGFQLSFAVVAAILLFQRQILRPLLRWSETDPFLPRSLVSRRRRFFERGYYWIAGAFSVSSAAWTGSLLLIAWYYYLLTPISLLANLCVVPIAFCILAVGMMSLLAAPVSTWLSLVFNNANWSLSQLVLALVQSFAQLPAGHVYVERPHWPNGARAEITVLDAGAGAAVHVRAGGADWLFDTGSARDYETFVRDYLHSRGINRLDGVVLSHGDSFHLGGALPLLEEFRPRQLLDNAAPDRSRVHHALLVRRTALLKKGDQFRIAESVRAQILFPPAGFTAKAADDQALVIRLDIGPKFRVLLLSDSGQKTEAALLAQPNDIRSDVLIKGRHYSGEEDSADFLAAVQPRLVVATSIAFPERERVPDAWAAALRAQGITLFRQDETGAVTIRIFDDRCEATPFLGQETFRSRNR